MLGLNKQVRFFSFFLALTSGLSPVILYPPIYSNLHHLPLSYLLSLLTTHLFLSSVLPKSFLHLIISLLSPVCHFLVLLFIFSSFFIFTYVFFSKLWHRSPIVVVVVVIQLYEIICEASQCCEPDPKCTGVSFPCWVHPVSTQPGSMSSSLYVLQFVSVANKIINTALSWTNNVKLLLSLFAGWVDTNCAEQIVNNLAP